MNEELLRRNPDCLADIALLRRPGYVVDEEVAKKWGSSPKDHLGRKKARLIRAQLFEILSSNEDAGDLSNALFQTSEAAMVAISNKPPAIELCDLNKWRAKVYSETGNVQSLTREAWPTRDSNLCHGIAPEPKIGVSRKEGQPLLV
jgi:hypothetical protein